MGSAWRQRSLVLADTIQLVLFRHGVTQSLHYLDDFIFVTSSEALAKQQRQILLTQFANLEVPLEPSKLEGPPTCLTFLDTLALQLRLPKGKLDRLVIELNQAVGRKTMSRKELQSLTGLLQHATKVVRPGRAFMRVKH